MANLSEKSWKKPEIELILSEIVKNRSITNGEVFWPFRALLSGLERSPGPGEIAEILGKKETLKRVEQALKILKG